MGQSWYFWAAVAAATVLFALIDLEALSKRRMGRVHALSLIVFIASFPALVLAGYPEVWLFSAAARVAVVAIVIGGGLLAGSARTGASLVHPEAESAGWEDMSMAEMDETLTPDQLAAEEAYEQSLREEETS